MADKPICSKTDLTFACQKQSGVMRLQENRLIVVIKILQFNNDPNFIADPGFLLS